MQKHDRSRKGFRFLWQSGGYTQFNSCFLFFCSEFWPIYLLEKKRSRSVFVCGSNKANYNIF